MLYDLPIVTMAGDLMRGRHSAAFLSIMDVPETLAATMDDYVSVAVRLARDAAWRSTIEAKMAAKNISSTAIAPRLRRSRTFSTASPASADRLEQWRGAHSATGPLVPSFCGDARAQPAHERAVDIVRSREEHSIVWSASPRRPQPHHKLNNGGHNDATGSVPPLTAIADVWTMA